MPAKLAIAEILIAGPELPRQTQKQGGVTIKARQRNENRIVIAARIPGDVPVSAFHFAEQNRPGLTVTSTRVGRLIMFTFTGSVIVAAVQRARRLNDFSQVRSVVEAFTEVVEEIDLTA